MSKKEREKFRTIITKIEILQKHYDDIPNIAVQLNAAIAGILID